MMAGLALVEVIATAVLSVLTPTQMKTGLRFPIWQSGGGFKTASLNVTIVSSSLPD